MTQEQYRYTCIGVPDLQHRRVLVALPSELVPKLGHLPRGEEALVGSGALLVRHVAKHLELLLRGIAQT